MSWCSAFTLLAAGLAGPAPSAQVEVRVVKYPELGNVIRSFKGKVVVADFWSDT
jgi:hypothetical protein